MIVVTLVPLQSIMKDQVSDMILISYLLATVSGLKRINKEMLMRYQSFVYTLQLSSFSLKGLSTAYVSGEPGNERMKEGVCNGLHQQVFFTPESIVTSKRWRKVLCGR